MIKQKETESFQAGHRARLRKKFLANQLSEPDILELLLTYSIPRRDVRILSRRLYDKYKTLYRILAAPLESLMENDGIKENTAVLFKVIYELVKMEYKVILDESPIFHNYEKLENYCKLMLASKSVEEFHVFYLDDNYQLIQDELHSIGTFDWSAVYTREIVKKALNLNAQHIVLLHNHPSGNSNFSSEDIEITTDLEQVLNRFDIKLYDHLLYANGILYSARNAHLLNTSKK